MLNQYRNLFEKAIRYWGIEAQLNMVSEENCEINLLLEKAERFGLDHTLSRVKKNINGSEEVEQITIRDWLKEECADGMIMLSQLALILGEGSVWEQIVRKIDRLRDKIFEIDTLKKEINCFGCKKTFYIDDEITHDLKCPNCNELLSMVGYNWVKVFEPDQGWTEDQEKFLEEATKTPFQSYQEKIYPKDGSIITNDDIESAEFEYLRQRYPDLCGSCWKRQLSSLDPFATNSECHYDGQEVKLDSECKFDPSKYKAKRIDE